MFGRDFYGTVLTRVSSLRVNIWFVGISLLASYNFFVVRGWESRSLVIINMYFSSLACTTCASDRCNAIDTFFGNHVHDKLIEGPYPTHCTC